MDSQLLMNGFMRLAVDNAALSSNIIFEVRAALSTPKKQVPIAKIIGPAKPANKSNSPASGTKC